MSENMSDHDVIIIGAGMAGAAAAYKLSLAGKSSLVLEARDRIGGRAYARPFASALTGEEPLEYGGSWIKANHHRIIALADAFGLTLRPRHDIRQRLAKQGDHVAPLAFETPDARLLHDAALVRVAMDAAMVKHGLAANEKGQPLSTISYADYMSRLNPSQATRDLFDAYWVVSGGGPQETVSAAEFLSSCGDAGGLAEHMIDNWVATVAPGMDVLAQRMLVASKAAIRLNATVAAIESADDHMEVMLANGESLSARAAIVALGVNQMKSIRFSPSLPQNDTILRGHDGKAFKLWVKARGIAPGTLITGDATGLSFVFAERLAADGTTLCICFGLQTGEAKPQDEAWVRGQFSALVPNAAFLAYDWHDWINDPFARGTWLSTPFDHGDGFDAAHWSPAGRIAFATSDIAAEQAGWFEGAVRSGEAAAQWAAAKITQG